MADYEISSVTEAPELFESLDAKLKALSRESKGKKIDTLENIRLCRYDGETTALGPIAIYMWGIDSAADLVAPVSLGYLSHVLDCRGCQAQILLAKEWDVKAKEGWSEKDEQLLQEAVKRFIYEATRKDREQDG